MDTIENMGIPADKCAAGVILADGTVVRLDDEPPAYAPTVKVTASGQR